MSICSFAAVAATAAEYTGQATQHSKSCADMLTVVYILRLVLVAVFYKATTASDRVRVPCVKR